MVEEIRKSALHRSKVHVIRHVFDKSDPEETEKIIIQLMSQEVLIKKSREKYQESKKR